MVEPLIQKQTIKKLVSKIKDGVLAIASIMRFKDQFSQTMVKKLPKKGNLWNWIFFRVFPKHKARIGVMLPASHTKEYLDFAIQAFKEVGKRQKVI